MAITRTAIFNDSGGGLDGTSLDNAWKQELYGQIDAMPAFATVVSPTTTGTVNNWAPGLLGNTAIRCNNASLLTITGIAGGVAGQRLLIQSVGAGQVDLSHADAGSSAGNKLQNVATSGKTSLAAGVGMAEYVYDATSAVWRLVSHEQGDWITVAFAAGNFGASGTMTWTVPSATTMKYWLRGRRLSIAFALDTTTVAAPLSTDLRILQAAYGGFTIAGGPYNNALTYALDNNARAEPAMIQTSGNLLRLLKNSFANWSASAALTTVYGQIEVGVS